MIMGIRVEINERKAIVLNPKDNVAVAISDLKSGEHIELTIGNEVVNVELIDNIPFGHKFSIRDIKEGEYIVKYGEVIGIATRYIRKGEHVHIHNVSGLRGKPR